MRHRRWKVWKLGFNDFAGIDYINQKTEKPAGRGTQYRPYPIEVPVPKATEIGEEGYRRLFFTNSGSWGSIRLSFAHPFNYGMAPRLREGRFDALWVHGWGHWFHLWALRVARRLGITVLMRGESGLHLRQPGGWRNTLKQRSLKYLTTHVDGYLAIGSLNRGFYESQGVPSSRIFPTPYAMDNAFFQARAAEASRHREVLRRELGLDPGRPVILYASKMTARKCAGDLLEAYAGLSADGRAEPSPYLLFVGDGEQRLELEMRAAGFGWRSIRFLGFKNQTELPRYYDLCDVFVLPSRQEPWGLVINEVMNTSRAVIASDEVGCGPDLVRHGENGYVFPAGDTASLANVLRQALANPEWIAAMGRRSLALVNRWSFDEDIVGLEQALAAVQRGS